MPANSGRGNDYAMSAIDYDLVYGSVLMRAHDAIGAARADGRDQAHIELWRALCPGGIERPAFELSRLTRDANLAAARRYAQSAGGSGITVEIAQRDNGRAYAIDLDLRW
jgi:hypothetical protein